MRGFACDVRARLCFVMCVRDFALCFACAFLFCVLCVRFCFALCVRVFACDVLTGFFL